MLMINQILHQPRSPNLVKPIPPHLDFGLHDEIDPASTKPKPNTRLQRLQALFDENDEVSFAQAMTFTRDVNLIKSVAKNRGFAWNDLNNNKTIKFDKKVSQAKVSKNAIHQKMMTEIITTRRLIRANYRHSCSNTVFYQVFNEIKELLMGEGKTLEPVWINKCKIDYYQVINAK